MMHRPLGRYKKTTNRCWRNIERSALTYRRTTLLISTNSVTIALEYGTHRRKKSATVHITIVILLRYWITDNRTDAKL